MDGPPLRRTSPQFSRIIFRLRAFFSATYLVDRRSPQGVYADKHILGASMADDESTDPRISTPTNISRRDVIKGVIAAGAVSSTSYLFRVPTLWAQASAPGAVERLITLTVNGH